MKNPRELLEDTCTRYGVDKHASQYVMTYILTHGSNSIQTCVKYTHDGRSLVVTGEGDKPGFQDLVHI